MSKDYRLKPVEIPNDDEDFCKRGFFAYGIFKKGQLAYSKIKDCVDHIEDDEINRELLLRDGMPIISYNESDLTTKGHKIFFIDGKEEETYEKICKILPKPFYRWSIIEIDEEEYNVLIGKRPGAGSIHYCDDNENYIDCFDGKLDPYFSRIIPFIRNEIGDLKHDENEIFRLQMYYMLLWSAIDRYCSLKYDVTEKQGDYLKALSKDCIFINALDRTSIEKRRPIFSANRLGRFKFDEEKPLFIINYYYTLRSNVVHRGKDEKNKIGILRSSLGELLEIFEIMIDETFE